MAREGPGPDRPAVCTLLALGTRAWLGREHWACILSRFSQPPKVTGVTDPSSHRGAGVHRSVAVQACMPLKCHLPAGQIWVTPPHGDPPALRGLIAMARCPSPIMPDLGGRTRGWEGATLQFPVLPAPSPLSLLSANALLRGSQCSCQGRAGLLQSLLGQAWACGPRALRPWRGTGRGLAGEPARARKCQLGAGHRHRLGAVPAETKEVACDSAEPDTGPAHDPSPCKPRLPYLLQAP